MTWQSGVNHDVLQTDRESVRSICPAFDTSRSSGWLNGWMNWKNGREIEYEDEDDRDEGEGVKKEKER